MSDMAGAMRKVVAPIPISHSHGQERGVNEFLAQHFERRSVVAIAAYRSDHPNFQIVPQSKAIFSKRQT
jgi:hypothetical protein